jgi:hypothetical protein
VENGKAVFGLPNEIHRRRCEDIRGDIEPALSEYFGQPVVLSLVVESVAVERVDDPPRPGAGSPTGPDRSISSTDATPATPDDEDTSDLSSFDDAEPASIVTVDNSAEARVLQAFPGAEEIR